MDKNHPLIAIHEAKYFKRGDGLAIGPGCFTRGLEFSTGQKAIVIGKPNPYFFKGAISDGIDVDECCMIGDVSNYHLLTQNTIILYFFRCQDANDDIAGALNIGMKGILVRTGKYLSGIESTMEPHQPNITLDNFSAAIEYLIEQKYEL